MEPCFLYQRQLGERVSTASCQARWWMVLLNLLQRCCIIVCHCSKSSYLLGQGCHRHHTASTPDFSPPLCGLSTSSLFHPSPSFPSPRWLRYHGGFGLFFVFFKDENKTELVALSNILCSLFPELGRATSCFLSPCTSAWEHLDSVGLSTSSRATITLSPSDTSHLLPASQKEKKRKEKKNVHWYSTLKSDNKLTLTTDDRKQNALLDVAVGRWEERRRQLGAED